MAIEALEFRTCAVNNTEAFTTKEPRKTAYERYSEWLNDIQLQYHGQVKILSTCMPTEHYLVVTYEIT